MSLNLQLNGKESCRMAKEDLYIPAPLTIAPTQFIFLVILNHKRRQKRFTRRNKSTSTLQTALWDFSNNGQNYASISATTLTEWL